MTLTVSFMLKIAFSDFVADGGRVFYKYILFKKMFASDLKYFSSLEANKAYAYTRFQ